MKFITSGRIKIDVIGLVTSEETKYIISHISTHMCSLTLPILRQSKLNAVPNLFFKRFFKKSKRTFIFEHGGPF